VSSRGLASQAAPGRAGTAGAKGPRVGIFGKVGAGNIGNDASMESVLGFLREDHPDAVIDAMCTGPETLRTRYGIDAIPMFWHNKFDVSGPASLILKVVGRFLDTYRTGAWVARHDVVIVPGAGVLEASLPMVPRGWPYALFLACGYGKLFRTPTAMVSVGAGAIKQPMTRWLLNRAAKMASYRSFRDTGARLALGQRGIDVGDDPVYPDLAFALPPPPAVPVDESLVAVGVMAYYGSNDDRRQADEIYARYVEAMKRFVRWLAETGHRVLLLVGDTNGSDGGVVDEIMADVHGGLPRLDPSAVTAASVSSYTDVMRVLMPVSSVVAIRYHNVLCAVKLGKPTISIGYSPKHDVLMANMGLKDFCQDVSHLDVDELETLFKRLEERSRELRGTVAAHNAAKAELLAEQFRRLTAAVFPPGA
jgi:polysaccharide pyruvyl transferase WcaK-like protein